MTIKTLQVGPIMTNCYLLCDEETGVCASSIPVTSRSRWPTWSAAPAAVWSTSC